MEQIQIDADPQLDDDNVMLIISGGHWLLNVNASPREWQEGLAQVPRADPSRRQDVRLGMSGGRPVWWSYSDQLALVVGNDVESYDFVVELPTELLTEIQAKVLAALREEWH
jgi:hypothetical protein